MRAERFRVKKPKRHLGNIGLYKLMAALAVIGLVAATPWAARAGYRFAAGRPLFAVTELRISGLKYVRKDDLIRYVGDPVGHSLLTLDTAGMIRKLAAHPWIKEASVKREVPDALRVEVLERNPAAIADTGSGRYLVDDEGFVLASITGGGWDYLPVIQYPASRASGLSPGVGAPELKEAVALMCCIRKDASERLVGAELMIDDDGLPCMRLEGALVRVGQGGYEDKVRRLSEVSQDVRRKGVNPTLIDLRFPGKVVVKG